MVDLKFLHCALVNSTLKQMGEKYKEVYIYTCIDISLCQYHNQWSRSLFLAVTHRSGQTQVKHETWIHISSSFVAASSFSFKIWFNFFVKVPNRIKDQVTDLSHKDHGPTIHRYDLVTGRRNLKKTREKRRIGIPWLKLGYFIESIK